MYKWAVYFLIEGSRIRCPVEADSIQLAISDACRMMHKTEEDIISIRRVSRIV